MSKSYRFTKYQRESKRPPFVIELDDGQEIHISQPDGDTIMDAEECSSTRAMLMTVCGEQWEEVEPLLSDLDGAGLREFGMDLARHFGMAPEQVPEGKRRK